MRLQLKNQILYDDSRGPRCDSRAHLTHLRGVRRGVAARRAGGGETGVELRGGEGKNEVGLRERHGTGPCVGLIGPASVSL